ncbi:aKG-HExxH-type peptide beta-hydroxylase [Streptomyces yaizuensis]|uniref:HEXXH motif-containing putative peptide modification protein n=1 Tax=Streptomyces yaizuensis TaxID=2989713 RepID=A0ABQ5NVW2_9ACTN|nr:HEXXH motif-containing putative peptide modification protein [Streptomyces sp. YSPA8]GLF94402.1 HEXXH motif-containing putative peptide modification protein [Streptomyces sp. YSPA8]
MRFLNYGHLCETTARFINGVTGNYPAAPHDLRPSYARAINTIRPTTLPAQPAGITIDYEDSGWVTYCVERSIFPHIVGLATASHGATREAWDRHVVAALDLIREIHPALRNIVDLFVTDVVVLNSGANGGGSANTMPGVVLVSPAPAWTTLDYAMCLVHEGLHTALFILECTYEMFTLPPKILEQEENRAYSAIKMEPRPFHAALHAAAVTVPLMAMEHQQGGSTLVDQYRDSLRASCADMKARRRLCTPYGLLLLDELCTWAEADELDFGRVIHSLTSPEYTGYKPPVAA